MGNPKNDVDRREKERKLRSTPRVSRLLLTSVEQFNSLGELEEELIGRTLNISEGGVLLELEHPLPLLCELTVSLAFGNQVVKAEGVVVRMGLNDAGKVETAIRFTRVPEESLKVISENPA